MRLAFLSPGRCRSDERGSVALIFAAAAPVLIAFTMATIEYGEMSSQKLKLQAAADAAALALTPVALTLSQADLEARAGKIVGNFSPDHNFRVSKLQVSDTGAELQLQVGVHADYQMKYLKAPGVSAVYPMDAYARSVASRMNYEIALVMDNSGSMSRSAGGVSKMTSAKDAAKRLVSALMGAQSAASRARFSVVPFTLAVNVGSQNANANWIDRYNTVHSKIHFENFTIPPGSFPPGYNATRFDLFAALKTAWAGCVETRPGNWAVTDAAPTASAPDSLFVPMAAPDEPGDAGATNYPLNSWVYPNSYVNDNPSPQCDYDRTSVQNYDRAQKKICKYAMMSGSGTSSGSGNNQNGDDDDAGQGGTAFRMDLSGGRGPNYGCNARPLLRLTGDRVALESAIDAMTAAGSTNLLEGFTWGWRTLSPNTPFADGQAYNASANRKIIVLLTDGMNSWAAMNNHNKSQYSSFGFYTNARLGLPAPTTAAEARAQMDAKTLQACANAKAAPNNVLIYTVGFSVPDDPIDSAGLDLLKRCASSPAMAYVANDSSSIVKVFEDIANNIREIRLAR